MSDPEYVMRINFNNPLSGVAVGQAYKVVSFDHPEMVLDGIPEYIHHIRNFNVLSEEEWEKYKLIKSLE